MTTPLKKLAVLVERLADKTESGDLEWNELHHGTFETTVSNVNVRVYEHSSDLDPEADPDYYVMLLEGGAAVDTVNDTQLRKYLPGAFSVMQSLYAGARRSARGVGDLADKLGDALKD